MSRNQSSSPSLLGRWLTFQIVLGVLSFIPVITGVLLMHGVHNPEYAPLRLPHDPFFDSNLRFVGGVWLGVGLTLWWLLPRIRSETSLLWALAVMIFVGGIGRVISWVLLGLPAGELGYVVIAITLLELVGMPLIVAWHCWLCRMNEPTR